MGGYADAVFQDGFDKGVEKGIEKGYLISLINLMETMGLNLKQAMEALKISSDDQLRYEKLIEEMSKS